MQPRHAVQIVNSPLTKGLNLTRPVCLYSLMSTVLIEIRRAKAADASLVAAAHDAAWRTSYRGIIPGPELEKLISRRGPGWWENAISKGSRVALLQFGDRVAGYANYGRNRARSLFYDGEIYELYLCPEFQGLGFGRRLFTAARRDLAQSGLKSLVIWALSDNDPAVGFYRALGGRAVARSSEKFGAKSLDKVAFGWQN
jgi:ribosomal protein S18 acetylase RimI-like enzyme